MDLNHVLGDFGTVQKRMFFFCLIRSAALVGLLYTIRLYAGITEHWCAPPSSFGNLTTNEWKECCIPETNKGYSRCEHYQIDDDGVVMNSSLVGCSSWNYEPSSDGTYSFVDEWDLVCDRRWYVSLLYTLFSAGSALTYGPSGYLADRYGRKPCIYIGIMISTLASFGSAFANSIYMMSVMQFLSGIGYAFLQHLSIIIFIELSGIKQRAYIPIFLTGFWGVSTILYSGVATIVPSWRYFLLFCTIPIQLATLIIGIAFVPESPRWMLSVRKYSRAEKEIEKMAAINGITLIDKESVMEALKSKIEMSERERPLGHISIKGFMHSKRLLTYTGILFSINICRSFVGNGFNINLANMGGHPKLNYISHGFTGIISAGIYELARPILKYRRMVLIGGYAFTGTAYIITTFIPNDLQWVKLMVALSGNILKKVANSTIYLIANELFPTHLRGKGMAGYMFSTRVGSILGSFSDIFVYNYGQNAIMFLFGGIYFLICIGVLFLPQTQDKCLPDSVGEAKLITKKGRKKMSLKVAVNGKLLPETKC